ncbi:MAG: type IV secretion system protein, partial [Propionivibrio sp.]|nr:type IV secretion system protein [Propionivibrio sp.]
MLNTFVTETAANIILGFQLVILTSVTLYITMTGYAISSGAVEQPFPTFMKQCIKILVIAAF